MSVPKRRAALDVLENSKRLLRLAAGITRNEVPTPELLDQQNQKIAQQSRKIKRQSDRLERKSQKIAQQSQKITRKSQKIGQQSKQIEQQSREMEQQSQKIKDQSQRLKQVWARVAEQEKQLEWNRQTMEEKDRWIARLMERLVRRPEERDGNVDPAKLVWILGTTRTGSTWLGSMMADLEGHDLWDEPMVGRLFGSFYNTARADDEIGQLGNPNFILYEAARESWTKAIRNFALEGAEYCNPALGSEDYLIIKEPNGSVGAPLLTEALPESRLIFLIRDPRDVVSSRLDAVKKGNWLYEREKEVRQGEPSLADTAPNDLVRQRAKIYALQIGKTREAYESHDGPKALLRYEDLRSDTLEEMKRLYQGLEISVDEEDLARVVEKHSWESIPEEQRGEGKFFRKGEAGGWKKDLTEEQVEIVEEITGPLLEEFYGTSRTRA